MFVIVETIRWRKNPDVFQHGLMQKKGHGILGQEAIEFKDNQREISANVRAEVRDENTESVGQLESSQ